MSIIVCRHGYRFDWLSDDEKSSVDQRGNSDSGRVNDPYLSDIGIQQAEDLAVHLSAQLADNIAHGKTKVVILCSPYIRCLQTILPFAIKLNIPICLEPGLREFFEPHQAPRATPALPGIEVGYRFHKDYSPAGSRSSYPYPKNLNSTDTLWGDQTVVNSTDSNQIFTDDLNSDNVVHMIDQSYVPIPGVRTNVIRSKAEFEEDARAFAAGLIARYHISDAIDPPITVICVTHAATKIKFVRAIVAALSPDPAAAAAALKMEVRCGVASRTIINGRNGSVDYSANYLKTGELRSWSFPDE
ncbi:hypothetical protein BJ742DRAFT_856956 [Cladochytrium replicatum]|nr:hypothetical protein BJ742DRAFT_856956 [Cladochytrium replicatum]